MQGLDYAYSHPNMDCVAQNYGFVARYIGDPDPNPLKYLDAPELGQLLSRGLSVVTCRETTAGFMFTDSGRIHAIASRAHLNALGMTGAVIFYACDVDFRGLTQAQKDRGTQFLWDAGNIDGGPDYVGVYGSDDAIDYWVGGEGFPARKGWQTYAWSSGRISPKAHFRQYRNGQAICGGTVDLNETYADDFGQWPRPSAPPPTTTTKDTKMYAVVSFQDHPEWGWWFTDFQTRRWIATPEEAGILTYIIRASGGICLTSDTTGPQPWPDHVLNNMPVVNASDQVVDFVRDPSGNGDVWFLYGTLGRWLLPADDPQSLADFQNHWAWRHQKTDVVDWRPEDLAKVPDFTHLAPSPQPEPVAWPATGKVVGEIVFTQ